MPESFRTLLLSADLEQVAGRRVVVASTTLIVAFVTCARRHYHD